MDLTVDELKKVIEAAIKEFAEAGKKGRDGYQQCEDDPTQPRGFGKAVAGDFTQKSAEGNRYKIQGSSNMGPYTSEGAILKVVESVLRERLKPMPSKRMEASAPYNASQAKIGEAGSVGNTSMPDWKSTKKAKKESSENWYDTKDMKKTRGKMKKIESNILQGVYEERTKGKK